jgi:gamma-glutamylcysteine synthetase
MKLRYYDDKKEKCMSHELHLELDYIEHTAMAESKEAVVDEMKVKIQKLIESLQKIDWSHINERPNDE